MDLSVVIVSWNVKDKLKNNLATLFKSQGDFKFEVFVVDNNSTDGSTALVSAEFPQVKLITNSDNRGFAAANNQAIKETSGQFILLLNPDMQVEPDTLSKTLIWARQNPEATVIGCRLINEQGETIKQVRRFPKLFDQLMIALKLPHLFPGIVNKYLASDFNYEEAAPVDSIRGAFFLINRASYQKISGENLPLLDEQYFIWFEEVDFCRQVYKLGGTVWYTPASRCLDYVGQSFKQVPRGQAQKYFGASMVKYFRKWESAWEAIILEVVWELVRMFL